MKHYNENGLIIIYIKIPPACCSEHKPEPGDRTGCIQRDRDWLNVAIVTVLTIVVSQPIKVSNRSGRCKAGRCCTFWRKEKRVRKRKQRQLDMEREGGGVGGKVDYERERV